MALVILLVFSSIGLFCGSAATMAGWPDAGEASAFVFYAAMVAAAASAISEVIGDRSGARGPRAAGRILLPGRDRHRATTCVSASAAGTSSSMRSRSVTPRGPTSRPWTAVADGGAGEKLAVVGPSGAGKSTLFQLLLRFYDPGRGTIRLDGVDIRLAAPGVVRSRVALVPQEPAIFATSVRENVRYARPDADDEAVRGACDAAFAMEFVRLLPGGLDAFLGERGVRLSGGQRQRLAIARAILSDRPVLLLDEATSALDSGPNIVQAALGRLMRGRTTLIIAHRQRR